MRKDGKYRFTLQFGADSEDQIRVGELLENLGNRKSTIIVSALTDYINAHPELQSGYSKIEVKVAPAFDRSQMERLIRSIVEEKLSELHTTETIADTSMSGTSEALEEDITKMLDNYLLLRWDKTKKNSEYHTYGACVQFMHSSLSPRRPLKYI